MEAYLDNAATTKVLPEVKEIMMETLEEHYGNPSSMHSKGVEAEKYIKFAKKEIAKSLKVEEKEIIFVSGGTEANNQALICGAMANKRSGNHIITTKIEHASVYNPLVYLESQGFRVTYVDVDGNGKVNQEQLVEAIGEDTILVSVMHVNNEIGAVEDIAEIGEKIKKKKPGILFHVDAIQSYGKFKIFPKRMHIDLLSVSGHKIHGPKGIGFLYVKDKTKVLPLIYGGGQQKGMRSGTENVPGIAGLGKAVQLAYADFDAHIAHMYELKIFFIDLLNKMEDLTVNGIDGIDIENTAPHVVSVTVDGVRSEVLLHALEDKNIYVSAGSACSSNHPALSGTLQAIGLEKKAVESTIRFSFSRFTTKEELVYTVETLEQLVPVLQKYVRR
ncbi:MAG: cysteine desulfurase [Lachnospiraceae bacterium]|nr:cysteine desulfurase [Lachnospiraceae bacterium]